MRLIVRFTHNKLLPASSIVYIYLFWFLFVFISLSFVFVFVFLWITWSMGLWLWVFLCKVIRNRRPNDARSGRTNTLWPTILARETSSAIWLQVIKPLNKWHNAPHSTHTMTTHLLQTITTSTSSSLNRARAPMEDPWLFRRAIDFVCNASSS